MIDRKYIDALEAQAKDRADKAQELIRHLDAVRRLAAELGMSIGGGPPGLAIPRPAPPPVGRVGAGTTRRSTGAVDSIAPDDLSARIDQTLASINLEDSDEVRKAYRRLWHHASKGGKKTMNAFKTEWHKKLFDRKRDRQNGEPAGVA